MKNLSIDLAASEDSAGLRKALAWLRTPRTPKTTMHDNLARLDARRVVMFHGYDPDNLPDIPADVLIEAPDLRWVALRVPSLVLGRWVYLRSWTVFGEPGKQGGDRTQSCNVKVVVAHESGGWVGVEGLEPMAIADRGGFEANRKAVDAYLVGLGAETVSSTEWPDEGEGIGPREQDRTPFRHVDWDEADRTMRILGYDGILDRTPVKSF